MAADTTMQRAERDKEMTDDDGARATKGDATDYGVELQKRKSYGAKENSSLSKSDSVKSDQTNEKPKKVKCGVSTLKLLLSQKGPYAIAIVVLIIAVLSIHMTLWI